jgi:hypothetical protein
MHKNILSVVAFPILKLVDVLIDSKGFWRRCITLEIAEFLDFVPLFIVLYSKEHNVSETGSVSVLS